MLDGKKKLAHVLKNWKRNNKNESMKLSINIDLPKINIKPIPSDLFIQGEKSVRCVTTECSCW